MLKTLPDPVWNKQLQCMTATACPQFLCWWWDFNFSFKLTDQASIS